MTSVRERDFKIKMQYKEKGFQKEIVVVISVLPPDYTGYNASYDVGANILCFLARIFLEYIGLR